MPPDPCGARMFALLRTTWSPDGTRRVHERAGISVHSHRDREVKPADGRAEESSVLIFDAELYGKCTTTLNDHSYL